MKVEALFGISVLMSFLAFGIVTKLYVLPRLRLMRREEAILPLVVPHAFRFVGEPDSFAGPQLFRAGLPRSGRRVSLVAACLRCSSGIWRPACRHSRDDRGAGAFGSGALGNRGGMVL